MNCDDCNGACCRWLIIGGNLPRSAWEFLQVRGARKLSDGRIAIPSKCPMLGEKMPPFEFEAPTAAPCLIYATRPIECKRFPVGGKDCLACRKLEGYE